MQKLPPLSRPGNRHLPVHFDSGLPAQALESRAVAWLERNRSALNAYNEHVEKDGVFSEGLRAF